MFTLDIHRYFTSKLLKTNQNVRNSKSQRYKATCRYRVLETTETAIMIEIFSVVFIRVISDGRF